jgi:endonuclease/exonuclease/phosphatase family metal-dependent hydrolase
MRLLTYNIHKGIGGGDRRYSLDRIIAVITGERPDLVCLQEVDCNVRRSSYDDQPALLAEALGAVASCYQLNVPRHTGGYGNLILSRWPFHTQHHVCIRHRRRKPRGAQLVVVDTPQGPLHLVNWHLGLFEYERRWQAAHLFAQERFLASAGLPTLVAGDFNDWRDLLGHYHFQGHGFHQVTTPVGHFRSFPAFLPALPLDKIFYRGPVVVQHAHIVRTQLARRASDHLPLVLDFHLAAASVRAADVAASAS